MDIALSWIINNYVEVTASALGIAYVLLAIRQNIWCWLLGIISVAMYIVIFYMERLYGGTMLQLFYLFFGIYGWYNWYFGGSRPNQLHISRIKRNTLYILFLLIIATTFLFGYLLSFTDNDIPYWDGFTTALGLAATWMTARKYIESWPLWIFANLVCVGVYYYKGLYPTVIYYAILAALAYRGYLVWEKKLKNA